MSEEVEPTVTLRYLVSMEVQVPLSAYDDPTQRGIRELETTQFLANPLGMIEMSSNFTCWIDVFGAQDGYNPTVALDFDGVLHEYKGWNGGRLGPPITDAQDACKFLISTGRHIVIYTTRPKEQVERWLRDNDFPPELEVVNGKLAFEVLVDDRAIKFEGKWTPDFVEQVLNNKTHWEDKTRQLRLF